MATYIHIPEPCHADWDKMQPEDQGKHCLQCCKTVVDFTSWEMADIASYLKENTARKTCGRFKSEQLSTPVESTEVLAQKIWRSSLPFYRKMAAVIVVFFALTFTSCDKATLDTMEYIITGQNPQQPEIMGLIAPPQPSHLQGDTILVDSSAMQKKPDHGPSSHQ